MKDREMEGEEGSDCLTLKREGGIGE